MSAQNTKQSADTKKKHIIIGVIVAILFLNVMWTVMQNKFTPKLDGIKTDVAGIDQRLAKIEQDGLPNVSNLKQDFEALKAVSAKFEERIEQLIKLEEEQLTRLEAQAEAQRARIEALKKLAAPKE